MLPPGVQAIVFLSVHTSRGKRESIGRRLEMGSKGEDKCRHEDKIKKGTWFAFQNYNGKDLQVISNLDYRVAWL